MLRKVVALFVLGIVFSNDGASQKNETSLSDPSVIEIGAYNVRKNDKGHYLIDIYASNNKPIAGVQFELLGQDFQILDVSGGRAAHSGFSFYNGKGGIVLAFSLQGKAVLPVEDVYKKVNPLFTIEAKKNNNETSSFNLKTLVSSPKGVKLESRFVPLTIN